MIDTLDEKDGVIARKNHGCALCGLAIPQGTAHYTQRNADGYSVWTFRAHSECHWLTYEYWKWCGIELRDVDWEDSIPHDEFRQFLASHKAEEA